MGVSVPCGFQTDQAPDGEFSEFWLFYVWTRMSCRIRTIRPKVALGTALAGKVDARLSLERSY